MIDGYTKTEIVGPFHRAGAGDDCCKFRLSTDEDLPVPRAELLCLPLGILCVSYWVAAEVHRHKAVPLCHDRVFCDGRSCSGAGCLRVGMPLWISPGSPGKIGAEAETSSISARELDQIRGLDRLGRSGNIRSRAAAVLQDMSGGDTRRRNTAGAYETRAKSAHRTALLGEDRPFGCDDRGFDIDQKAVLPICMSVGGHLVAI